MVGVAHHVDVTMRATVVTMTTITITMALDDNDHDHVHVHPVVDDHAVVAAVHDQDIVHHIAVDVSIIVAGVMMTLIVAGGGHHVKTEVTSVVMIEEGVVDDHGHDQSLSPHHHPAMTGNDVMIVMMSQ